MLAKKRSNFDTDDEDSQYGFKSNSSIFDREDKKTILQTGTLGLTVDLDRSSLNNSNKYKYKGEQANPNAISTVKTGDVVMMKRDSPLSETAKVTNYAFGYMTKDNEEESEIMKRLSFFGFSLVDLYIKPQTTNFTLTATPTGVLTIPVVNPSIFTIGDSVTPGIMDSSTSTKNVETGKFTIKPLEAENKIGLYRFFSSLFKENFSATRRTETENPNQRDSKNMLRDLIEYIKILGFLEYGQKAGTEGAGDGLAEFNWTARTLPEKVTRMRLVHGKKAAVMERHIINKGIKEEQNIKQTAGWEADERERVIKTDESNFEKNPNNIALALNSGILETSIFLTVRELMQSYELQAPQNIGMVVGKRANGVDVFVRQLGV